MSTPETCSAMPGSCAAGSPAEDESIASPCRATRARRCADARLRRPGEDDGLVANDVGHPNGRKKLFQCGRHRLLVV